MAGSLGRWWRRLRAGRNRPVTEPSGEASGSDDVGREPGRAHLVLRDGRVVEAPLDPEDRARAEYLARRAAPPPPPRPKQPEHPL